MGSRTTAHCDRRSLEDSPSGPQRLPEGEYTLGDRRIHTGARLVPGDRLEVVEPDGTTSRWTVRALEKQTSFLVHYGIDRRTYLLKRLI